MEEKTVIVKNPVREWPNYELPEGASVEEMRDMAVRAMRDELTFEWTPETTFTYKKSGACSGKHYEFDEGMVYSGLPYTTGGTGIFQWLLHCNPETGVFSHCVGEDMATKYGNSCAASVNWGLSAVCSSLRGGVSTYAYVYRNGHLPLGDVKYPSYIHNFAQYPTDKIVADNGADVVLEGYALARKGDAVIATDRYEKQITARHAMMLTEDAVVVRFPDGKINPEESYIIEQDQRSKEHVVEKEEGYSTSIRGRLDHKCTFADLLKDSYIALTTLEFAGKKPYEPAFAKCDHEVTDKESLLSAHIISNYRIVCAFITVTDEAGLTVFEHSTSLDGWESDPEDLYMANMPLPNCVDIDALSEAAKPGCTVKVQVVVANGARRTPIEIKL